MTLITDVRSGQKSDIGRKRVGKPNQDRLGSYEPVSPSCPDFLYVVCDGMGGYKGGEIASQLAVATIVKTYRELADELSAPQILREAIKRAHEAIRQYHKAGSLGSMGTTAVVAAIRGERLYVANVGDSRAYILRQGKLRQITEDHSKVSALVRAKVITAEEAKTSKVRNELNRSLSAARTEIEADIFEEDFRDGDALVLCSDGLWGPAGDANIRAIVSKLPPEAAAERLIQIANQAWGPDNISAIIVRRGE